MYCINPVKIEINRWKFRDWTKGKLDKSELDGDKVNLWELREKAKDNPVKNTPPIVLSNKEKDIMDIVIDIVNKNTYVVEKDIIDNVDMYSKALITRTIRNEDILNLHKLQRVRATKQIKERYNLDTNGYPFLIVKTR